VRRVVRKKPDGKTVVEYVATLPKAIVEALGWGDGETRLTVSISGKDRIELRREKPGGGE